MKPRDKKQLFFAPFAHKIFGLSRPRRSMLICIEACASHLKYPSFPIPSSTALQHHISRMRSVGITITEAVGAWRKIMGLSSTSQSTEAAAAPGSHGLSALGAAFTPFLWRGVDYLVKMFHDSDFITELPGAVSLGWTLLFIVTWIRSASYNISPPPFPTHLLPTLHILGNSH